MKRKIFEKFQNITKETKENKLNYFDVLKKNKKIKISKDKKVRLDKIDLSKDELSEMGFGIWGSYYLLPIWLAPYIHPKTKGVKAGNGNNASKYKFKDCNYDDHIMGYLNFGFKPNV